MSTTADALGTFIAGTGVKTKMSLARPVCRIAVVCTATFSFRTCFVICFYTRLVFGRGKRTKDVLLVRKKTRIAAS